MLPESHPPEKRRRFTEHVHEKQGTLLEVLRLPGVRMVLVYAALTFFALDLIQSSYALVVARNVFPALNLEESQFAMSMLLAWTGVVIVITQAAMVGPLVRRFGETRLLLVSALLRAPAFVGMAFVHHPWIMAVWVVPMALGNGIGQPAQQALVCSAAPEDMPGEVLGVLTSTSSLAMVVGPLLSGLMLDVDTSAPDLLATALTVGAVLVSLVILKHALPATGTRMSPAAAEGGR